MSVVQSSSRPSRPVGSFLLALGVLLVGREARAGTMTDSADVIIEADVSAVRQRFHEIVPDLPVQVYTLTVAAALKGQVPDVLTLVIP